MRRHRLSVQVLVALSLLTVVLSCGGGGGGGAPAGPAGSAPVAPTGLTATAASQQVSLTWTASSGATSYNVYWSLSAGVSTATGSRIAGITSSSYVHTGRTNGTAYHYVVTAVNAVGESAASAAASATPAAPSSVPAAPTGVTATAGNGQTTLAWSAVGGATSYNIYWSTSTSVNTATGTKIANLTAPTYNHTGLTNSTTYYYIVTAQNSLGEGPASSPAVSAAPTTRAWTYLVYLGGDNNLSPAALLDINEMEKVGSDANLAIVVQAEFSSTYSAGSPTTTRRYYIQNDGNASQPNLASPVQILGNVDMANPATLTAFITWAKTNYPAQHYALVVWDHGAGWKASRLKTGLERGAVEDATSGTFMSLPDLAKGVADAGLHFDLINFDACLMAMYEVAYQFKGMTDYLVFSEETEPGDGDPYDTILGALKATPSMSGRTLSTTIVDKYNAFFLGSPRDSTTKSAIDMSQIDSLHTKIKTLAATLTADTASKAVVQAAQKNSQEYTYPANHDLYDFCDYLVTHLTNSAGAAGTACSEIKTQIGTMVVASKLTNGTDPQSKSVAKSRGLAIYIPQSSETNAADLAAYGVLAANTGQSGTTWGAYIAGETPGGGTAQYAAGDFALYVYWTKPDGSACNADLDLYVVEPNYAGGLDFYAPWMGQTSPNGFFSAESTQSGFAEEYYVTNAQVIKGTYTFLINYYANGASCTQALTHLKVKDTAICGGPDWCEPAPAVLLDLSNPAPATCADFACLNNYSDWWVPGYITRAYSPGSLQLGVNLTVDERFSKLIQLRRRGSVLGSIVH